MFGQIQMSFCILWAWLILFGLDDIIFEERKVFKWNVNDLFIGKVTSFAFAFTENLSTNLFISKIFFDYVWSMFFKLTTFWFKVFIIVSNTKNCCEFWLAILFFSCDCHVLFDIAIEKKNVWSTLRFRLKALCGVWSC